MRRLMLLLLVLISVLSLTGCASLLFFAKNATPKQPFEEGKKTTSPIQAGGSQVGAHVPGELIATVESQADAEKIAELYGITLVSVEGKIAVFSTDQDLGEVIAKGVKNGWHPLSRNDILQMY